MDDTDAELLAAFARNRSEDAFRELLRRHLGMVFATARRLVGDAHEAEEVAQTVFQLFAEKAGTIAAGQPLAGWLYHAARHHALHRVRSEGRRRQREQFAAAMSPATESAPPPPLLAELEEVLTELAADERDVLVLRFLEDRQLREVGRELGVSEEAARKRVARALERLREVFARRGITASTGAITVALLGQAGVGVPATLGASIATTVLGGTAVAAATTAIVTQTTATTMNLFNLKTAAAILGAAAVTGTTTYVVQERRADQLRADYQTLNETRGKLAAKQQEARELIQLRDEQIAVLKGNIEDLPRLRGVVDRLNRQLEEQKIAASELERLRGENRELRHLLDLKQNNQGGDTGREEVGIYYPIGPDAPVGMQNIGPRVFGPRVGVAGAVSIQSKTGSPGMLATERYNVDWEKLSAFLGRVDTHIDDSQAASLIRAYFQLNGVKPEVQSVFTVSVERRLIGVRSDTNTLERISQLMAPFVTEK